MKIGIFGGSYNPPHKMHYRIAEYLLNKHYVDKVIFVPTGSKYKYKNNLIDDNDRLEMLKIMTRDQTRMEVSDYELKDYVVYTYETLAYYKKLYLKDEIYFICGADNLSYIDEWKNGEEILSNYKIIVIGRNTNNIINLLEKFKKYENNIIVAPLELCDISSTLIRELISKKKFDELESKVDKDVIKYIKVKKLYNS